MNFEPDYPEDINFARSAAISDFEGSLSSVGATFDAAPKSFGGDAIKYFISPFDVCAIETSRQKLSFSLFSGQSYLLSLRGAKLSRKKFRKWPNTFCFLIGQFSPSRKQKFYFFGFL